MAKYQRKYKTNTLQILINKQIQNKTKNIKKWLIVNLNSSMTSKTKFRLQRNFLKNDEKTLKNVLSFAKIKLAKKYNIKVIKNIKERICL